MDQKSIYFPFAAYDREIHARESSFEKYQMSNGCYDNRGKACAVPYETAKPYLKRAIDWMWYLMCSPAEYHRCNFSTFRDLELYFLLRERVELCHVVPWRNMEQEYKDALLACHPELAENLSQLQTLSGNHWQKILQLHPQYIIYLPEQKLSGNNWQVILEGHPELAQYCDFSLLEKDNWNQLLKVQIGLLPFCPENVLKELTENPENELFIIHPELRKIFCQKK